MVKDFVVRPISYLLSSYYPGATSTSLLFAKVPGREGEEPRSMFADLVLVKESARSGL